MRPSPLALTVNLVDPDQEVPTPLPRIYLDVTGVLLAGTSPPTHFTDHISQPSRPFSLSMLKSLAAAEANIYWLSTDAVDDIPILVATRIRVHPGPRSHVDPTWWKFDALAAAHPRGVPFIWVDPTFSTLHDSQCRLAAEALDALRSPCLLITPNPTEGLSHGELDRILAFAHRFSSVKA